MTPRERVALAALEHAPLAPLTTFRIGGPARLYAKVGSEAQLAEARALARARNLPLLPLGGGSNLLVPDEGVDALVAKITIGGMSFSQDGEAVRATAGAGVRWDELVDAAAARGLWGLENLAGVPGTVGGAVVQNIGAYGAALSDACVLVEAFDLVSGEARRFTREACAFGYRDSVFKRERRYAITRATFLLRREAGANFSYRDPSRRYADLESFFSANPQPSPAEIAAAIRAIRAEKFPDLAREGTAGSFFANPLLPQAQAQALAERIPGLPLFALPETDLVKVPLGWLLDQGLHLRGYARGRARLYEKHALVVVASFGARASEVDALARDVERKVLDAFGIALTREVETFGAKKFSESYPHVE